MPYDGHNGPISQPESFVSVIDRFLHDRSVVPAAVRPAVAPRAPRASDEGHHNVSPRSLILAPYSADRYDYKSLRDSWQPTSHGVPLPSVRDGHPELLGARSE